MGEYDDGRLGEIFVDASKMGSAMRGVMDDFARTVSLALQNGVTVDYIATVVKGSCYPPNGEVSGSAVVTSCTSVTDWVLQELLYYYREKT